MAREVNVPINIGLKVSGEGKIKELERQVRSLEDEVQSYRSKWEEATRQVMDFQRQLENVRNVSGIAALEEELEVFKATASQAEDEVRNFLRAMNMDELRHDSYISDLINDVKKGALTANQAIASIKANFQHVMEDNYYGGHGLFDSQQVQTFLATLDELSKKVDIIHDKIVRIETDGVSVASGGGGGGGFGANLSEQFKQIAITAEAMSEKGNAAVGQIVAMTTALNEFGGIDVASLLQVAHTFENIANIGQGSFSSKSVDNLVDLARKISNINQNGDFRFSFNLEGLKDFKVSSTIHHLSDFLATLNEGQISSLERLSKISLANFHQDNLKISKATADNLAEMVKVEQAQHQEAEAVKQTDAAYQEHQKEVEAAAKAEEEKAKISELLAKALAKEEERTRSAGKSANEHAQDVSRMLTIWKEISRLMSSQEKLKIEDPKQFAEVTRQLDALRAEYDRLYDKTEDSLTDKEIAKLTQAREDAVNRIRIAQAAAADSTAKLNATQMVATKIAAEKADASRSAAIDTARQKAEQDQLNKTYRDTISTLKELGKARADRQKWSGDKESEEYKRADERVKELTVSYRKLRSELGSDISIEQQQALTKEINNQAEAYKNRKAAMEGAAQRKDEAERAAAEARTIAQAQADAIRQQKAEQEQLNKTYREAAGTLKELGAARAERQKFSNDKESAEYQRANEKVKELTESYRSLRAELGSDISVAQQKALTDEIKRQVSAYKDRKAAMEGSAQRKDEAAKAAAEAAAAAKEQTDAITRQKAEQTQLNRTYQEALKTLKELGAARADRQKYSGDPQSAEYQRANEKVKELTASYRRLRSELGSSLSVDQQKALTEEIQRQITAFKDRKAAMTDSAHGANDAAAEKVRALTQEYNSLGEKTEEVNQKMTALNEAIQRLNNTPAGSDARKQAMEDYRAALESATKAVKDQAAAEKEQERLNGQKVGMLTKLNAMLVQCEAAQRKYALAAKLGLAGDSYKSLPDTISNIRQLINELNDGTTVTKTMDERFKELQITVSNTSRELKTSGGLLGRWATTGMQQLTSRLSYSIGLAAMVYKAAGEIKKMVSTAVELDTAMNQLQIVTRSSAADMDVYAKRVSAMAKETGQATKDLIDASTVYARLGYSMDDSAVLSKFTAMLQGVGRWNCPTA